MKVLADDNRIRSTVLAPKFDEATVQDILDDLRKSSGATLLAVRRRGGQGARRWPAPSGLRDVNLGASPAVKTGFDRPTSDVWTLPDQVQVVGVAPIRSGDQTPALLVKGLSLGRSQLATVGKALGVTGALFIGERVAASSADGPELDEALRAAGRMVDGTEQVSAGGRSYLVRARARRRRRHGGAARLAGPAPSPVRARADAVVSRLVPGPALRAHVFDSDRQRTTKKRRKPVRTPTATKALIAAFAAILVAMPRAAWAAESSDVEELRREVRQLQAQVQGLRTAIAEAAEFDRQRAALLTRR